MRKRDEVNVHTEGFRKGANFKVYRRTYARLKTRGNWMFVINDSLRLYRDMYYPGHDLDYKKLMITAAKERGTTQKILVSSAIELYLDITEPPASSLPEPVSFMSGKKVFSWGV